MKQMTKIGILAVLLIGFQNVFGQNNKPQISETNVYQKLADAEFDLTIRINSDMNDEELHSRIDVLHSFDEDIEIHYSRDESGNIKTLSSSGGKSSGSCKSDNFDFLIISLTANQWKGFMISDKK